VLSTPAIALRERPAARRLCIRSTSSALSATAGRLIGRPPARAAARPVRVRSAITSRSHSAIDASTFATGLPPGVEVSTPRSRATRVISASCSNHSTNRAKSTTDRLSRSSRETTRPSASPPAIAWRARSRPGRSTLPPDSPSSLIVSASSQPLRAHSASIARHLRLEAVARARLLGRGHAGIAEHAGAGPHEDCSLLPTAVNTPLSLHRTGPFVHATVRLRVHRSGG
jgi:hypothetical protein